MSFLVIITSLIAKKMLIIHTERTRNQKVNRISDQCWLLVLGLGQSLQNNIQSFISKNERIFTVHMCIYQCCTYPEWL